MWQAPSCLRSESTKLHKRAINRSHRTNGLAFFGFWVKGAGSLAKVYLARPVQCPELISKEVTLAPEASCCLAAF